MKYPLLSIVITTYNSERTLEKVLVSLFDQTYPKDKMEILVIDGGSNDKTLIIAKKFGCKVFKNPKTDQVFGKFIGYKKAKGELLLLIDSDEVLESKNSVELKADSILMNEKVKVSISSGLKKPRSYPDINYYLNEFGDPFSYFMYRNSKDPRFFLSQLRTKYVKVYEDSKRVVFDFSGSSTAPFIELTAMAVMVNLKYIKGKLPQVFRKPPLHTHLFYLLNTNGNLFAVMKHDPVIHYSVATIGGYLRKIRSRITSNIYRTGMGVAGFTGRESYHSIWYRYKKYLFLFYVLTIILPVIDSIYLVLTRRKAFYLIHAFLCYYTFAMVLFFFGRKLFGLETKLFTYGGK